MSHLQSGMFTRGTFAIVLIANHHPWDTSALVSTCHGRDSIKVFGQNVVDRVSLIVLCVDGTNQHVVADVVKMATVLEPRASHTDVVGCALAFGLDQHWHIQHLISKPRLERCQ
eukprot:Lithocolla_globosa_v1_NODE_1456_length_2560_cov_45.661876.p2 type:complete len:114 gc:universal NODE_1456_length_2560_cov_45.661876:2139-1798(-)